MKKNKQPSPRDVALYIESCLRDFYGENVDCPQISEGLWLAMQLVGGPQQAANVMRYCGVNFADR